MTSLAGRELPADLVQQVSSLTMGQLFHILSHIQKLSAQAPVTAQALLTEHPPLCHALLHAECIAGMVEEPSLPMSKEELKRAKTMSRHMQVELEDHELPQPEENSDVPRAGAPQSPQDYRLSAATAFGASVSKAASFRPPPSAQFAKAPGPYAGGPYARNGAVPTGPGAQTAGPRSGSPPATATGSTGDNAMGSLMPEGGTDEQKQALLQRLVQLTPEQVAKLPNDTKMQLLEFLKQHKQQPRGQG